MVIKNRKFLNHYIFEFVIQWYLLTIPIQIKGKQFPYFFSPSHLAKCRVDARTLRVAIGRPAGRER